jgi:hypothetical protein
MIKLKLLLVIATASCIHGASLDYTCGNFINSPSFVCNGDSSESQALEVQDMTTSMIYASSGDNPMTYDEFITYPEQVGIWKLNTPRNLQFNENCFFKSPSSPIDCEPGTCINNKAIKALNDTTWGELALNVCSGYYPSGSTDVVLGPAPEGQVLIAPISKCQNMTFDGPQAWVLTDEYKNQYIMHASGANTTEGVDQAVQDAVFPEGWTIEQVDLPEPFTIYPDMDDEGNCYYTVVRDSADNSYHMIGCSPDTPRPTDMLDACPAAIKSSAATPSPSDGPSSAPSPSSPSSHGVMLSSTFAIATILALIM